MMENVDSLILGIGILILLLLLTLGLLAIYSGLLYDVTVKTGAPYIGRVTVAYKFQQGPMSETGAIFSESTSIAPQKIQIGLFYDNPDKVPKEKLRWAVAAVISDENGVVDEELWNAFKEKKYQQAVLPEVKTSVNADFPHTSMISILLGVYKVYPKFNAYCNERGLLAYPYLEIYDKGYINYMAPLENQMKFFVPEALQKMDEFREYYTEEEWSICEQLEGNLNTLKTNPTDDPAPTNTSSAPPVETSSAPPVETSSAPPLETGSAPPLETGSAPPLESDSASPVELAHPDDSDDSFELINKDE